MNIVTHNGANIDCNKVERVKPVYGDSVRVYFDDCYVEYADPDGRLGKALTAALEG
jgi:hypothetical protein